MSSVSADIVGAAELTSSLRGAADQLAEATTLNREEGAATLNAARIPRETGYLESTATVTATGAGFSLTATAPYAAVVHARDPFFLRALKARTDAVVAAHAQHVADVLTTVQGA